MDQTSDENQNSEADSNLNKTLSDVPKVNDFSKLYVVGKSIKKDSSKGGIPKLLPSKDRFSSMVSQKETQLQSSTHRRVMTKTSFSIRSSSIHSIKSTKNSRMKKGAKAGSKSKRKKSSSDESLSSKISSPKSAGLKCAKASTFQKNNKVLSSFAKTGGKKSKIIVFKNFKSNRKDCKKLSKFSSKKEESNQNSSPKAELKTELPPKPKKEGIKAKIISTISKNKAVTTRNSKLAQSSTAEKNSVDKVRLQKETLNQIQSSRKTSALNSISTFEHAFNSFVSKAKELK